MSETSQQVEVLITRGLALYEHGDIDAAILVWEEALNLDPENPRANGYVDYVRMHYEVLTGGPANDELAVDVPFGVSTAKAPEYRIAIAPFGAAPPKVNHTGADAVDEGWFLEADALVSQFKEFEAPAAPMQASGEVDASSDVAQVSGELDSGTQVADHPIDRVATVIAVADDAGAAFEMTADEPSGNAVADAQFDAAHDAGAAFEMTADEPSENAAHDAGAAFEMTADEPSENAAHDAGAALEMTADEPSENAVADAQFDAAHDAGAAFEMTADEQSDVAISGANEISDFAVATLPAAQQLGASAHPTLDFSDDAIRDAAIGDDTATQLSLLGSGANAEPVMGAATTADFDALELPRSGIEYDADEPTASFVLGQLEFEADEPDGASYNAGYAEDLDASFGVTTENKALTPESVAAPVLEAEFDSLETGIRQRDNGFVAPRPKRKSHAPELKMTLRTPTSLDDIDLDELQVPAAPLVTPPVVAPPTARTVSRPTSQLVGLARRPLPLRSDEASSPTIFIPPATPALGRGKTRSDLFPVSNAALIPPAAGKTEDLEHSAVAAVRAASDQDFATDRATPEVVIEPLAPLPEPLDALDEQDEDTRFDSAVPAAVTQALGRAATEHEPVLAFDPIAAGAATLLREIDINMLPDENRDDRVRRRISSLLDLASHAAQRGELHRAVTAIDLALSQDPESALGQKLIHRHRDAILHVLQQFLGDMSHRPKVAKPMHELNGTFIGPRAAFLVSRVDGDISYDELLDVSGMPRMEAYRYLCQLAMRGVLA